MYGSYYQLGVSPGNEGLVYWNYFSELTGINTIAMEKIFSAPTDQEKTLWQTVSGTVNAKYSNYCSGVNGMCSSADLTIAQWNQMAILSDPLVEAGGSHFDFSYVSYYMGYSSLQYPPEYKYYAAFSASGASGSIRNVEAATAMNTYGFFNMKIWQDFYLGITDSGI